MITAILADDHPIVRQGLRALLEGSGCRVVGEADDGLVALDLVARLRPDVALVDLTMPGLGGLEVVRRLRRDAPETRAIVLSQHADEPYVLEALRGGAAGYILKSSATAHLVDAIRSVVAGRRYLCPPLADRAIDAYLALAEGEQQPPDRYALLTAREREVLHLAAEGHSNAEIGDRLAISPRTAETHRTNLQRKLGLKSQTDLVRYAVARGLIEAAHP
jgi:DNA-binding NarL/FixJ family response regulator